jgi:fluoride ion exporter CrcB/FEX
LVAHSFRNRLSSFLCVFCGHGGVNTKECINESIIRRPRGILANQKQGFVKAMLVCNPLGSFALCIITMYARYTVDKSNVLKSLVTRL